jgi:recombination protein RecT
MNAAQLGLEPNTPLGQAYLIPFKNHGVLETQFQIGYKGMIDLAHRSGEITNIYAKEVYESDEFDYAFGLEPFLRHKPSTASDKGKITFYYAVYKLTNGGYGFDVMSYSDVAEHAKRYSKAFENGPWQTNFDEMAKKTVLKRVLKYAPIKTEFVRQIAEDGSIKIELSENMSEIENKNVFEGTFEETGENAADAKPDQTETGTAKE